MGGADRMTKKDLPRDLECVGLCSLFSEADRNATERERHVGQVDIDNKSPLLHPKKFRQEVLRIMRAHGVMDAYVFETRKGIHVWTPWLQSFRFMLRFEKAFGAWTLDGQAVAVDENHTWFGRINGSTVLRFTPKPQEGELCFACKGPIKKVGENVAPDGTRTDIMARVGGNPDCPRCLGTSWTGPRFIVHLRVPDDALAPWSFWSKTHWDFMQARYQLPDAVAPRPADRAVECDGLRTERYFTYRPEADP
jgi:hypothetical protein